MKKCKARTIEERKATPMKNITINIPQTYENNIQLLIQKGLLVNRSETVRTAIREFLLKEYNENLDLLGFKNI